MNPWTSGLFGAIFLAMFGAGVCGFGIWLALRLDAWKRWVMALVALGGASIVYFGLKHFITRFHHWH